MASGHFGAVLKPLHRLFGRGSVSGLAEGQLLDRFVEGGDEAAFSALVSRLGPMVIGVCRRQLDDPHDVEDAFQATFLVLVRKAGSIRDPDRIGPWLYGVAHRVSVRARSNRRRDRERSTAIADTEAPALPDPDFELQPILDDEIRALPEKYRTPVILCYLEGLTHDEAAQRLRCPVGTVRSRLAWARERLRTRLDRRGVGFGSVPPIEIVPFALTESTVKAAACLAAGKSAIGLASAGALALSKGVGVAMLMNKFKLIAGVALTAGLLTGSAAVLARQAGGGKPAAPDAEKSVEAVPVAPADDQAKPKRLEAMLKRLSDLETEIRHLREEIAIVRTKGDSVEEKKLPAEPDLAPPRVPSRPFRPEPIAPPSEDLAPPRVSSHPFRPEQRVPLPPPVLLSAHEVDRAQPQQTAPEPTLPPSEDAVLQPPIPARPEQRVPLPPPVLLPAHEVDRDRPQQIEPEPTLPPSEDVVLQPPIPPSRPVRVEPAPMPSEDLTPQIIEGPQVVAIVPSGKTRIAAKSQNQVGKWGAFKTYNLPEGVKGQPILGGNLVSVLAEGQEIPEIAVYDLGSGDWAVQKIDPPAKRRLSPGASASGATYVVGNKIYSYNVTTHAWDVVDLDRKAEPTVKTPAPGTGRSVDTGPENKAGASNKSNVPTMLEGFNIVAIVSPNRDKIAVRRKDMGMRAGEWALYSSPKGSKITPVLVGDILATLSEGPEITEVAVYNPIISAGFGSGTWSIQKLVPPAKGRTSPEVNQNSVFYTIGNRIFAYSVSCNKWGVLKIDRAAAGEPVSMTTPFGRAWQDNQGLHVFSPRTGNWDDLNWETIEAKAKVDPAPPPPESQ